MTSRERSRNLNDGRIIEMVCPKCDCENSYERHGIRRGHDYLGVVDEYDMYDCPDCDCRFKLANPFIYGFVRN